MSTNNPVIDGHRARCGNCKWFCAFDIGSPLAGFSQCRKHPPVPGPTTRDIRWAYPAPTRDIRWAYVDVDDWCGEFEVVR